jgi:hypothetical protein
MLSFDISVIDVVLSIVILILLLLFVTQRKSQSGSVQRTTVASGKEMMEDSKVGGRISVETSPDRPSADSFQGCVHQFGHLRSMPKGTAVPEECFGCPKVLHCMFQNE